MNRIADITPFILTYNEEPNIGRCLARLNWAAQIVVVDSGSSDHTLDIVARFPRARVFHRPFDTHARQANFALGKIQTPWVLSLDADYLLTSGFEVWLTRENLDERSAYFASFEQCVRGRALKVALYPPRAVLFARARAFYDQDGHTQRLAVTGRRLVSIPAAILHDDRKPLRRWWDNQRKYAALEAEKLISAQVKDLSWPDKLRRTCCAPLGVGAYVLFARGGIRDGWLGLHYALERTVVEFLLSWALMRKRLRGESKSHLLSIPAAKG